MKIRVWNQTSIDLWSGIVVTHDVILFFFRSWNAQPEGTRQTANKIEVGHLGTWVVKDSFPIDPNTGMAYTRVNATLPFKACLTASPKGWMGIDVFILTAAPDALN